MSDNSIFVVKDECRKLLIQKPCDKSWRGAECKLVQPRVLAMKTGPHGRIQRTFQEEEGFDGFDFRESATQFFLILSLFILVMCVVGPVFLSRVSRKLATCANHCSIMCAV